MLKKIKNFQYKNEFLIGLVSALSFAPFYILPVVFFAIIYLFLKVERVRTKKHAFWSGLWFGSGHALAGTYWICISLLVDAKSFAWLIPFSLLGFSFYFALYIALTTLIYKYFSQKFKINFINKCLLFAFLWSVFELGRGWAFTGFPWNLIVSIWSFSDIMIQVNSVFGVYFYGLITIFMFLLASPVFTYKTKKISHKPQSIKDLNEQHKKAVILSFLIFLGVFVFGANRLHNADVKFIENMKIRIVQPNIEQSLKWDSDAAESNFRKIIRMSRNPEAFKYRGYSDTIKDSEDSFRQDSLKNVDTIIVWPETAVPYLIGEKGGVLDIVKDNLKDNEFLITGGLHAKYSRDKLSDRPILENLWNSIFYIDSRGQVRDVYDKIHLVMFGEYIPFKEYLPYMSAITQGSINLSKGIDFSEKKIKLSETISFKSLVCYESVFQFKREKQNINSLIINLTNDAWFGNSSGPYQHLDLARIRSVENGMSMIRVANNGVSAVIDPYGRILHKTNLNETIVIDSQIPYSIYSTFYNKINIKIAYIFFFIYFSIYFYKSKKQ